jgi:hypothetical protein
MEKCCHLLVLTLFTSFNFCYKNSSSATIPQDIHFDHCERVMWNNYETRIESNHDLLAESRGLRIAMPRQPAQVQHRLFVETMRPPTVAIAGDLPHAEDRGNSIIKYSEDQAVRIVNWCFVV